MIPGRTSGGAAAAEAWQRDRDLFAELAAARERLFSARNEVEERPLRLEVERIELQLKLRTSRPRSKVPVNQRKATGLCVRCGLNPLETRDYCGPCRTIVNARVLVRRGGARL